MKRDKLKIGNRTAESSLIQGGMGMGISLSGLAGAVAGKRQDPYYIGSPDRVLGAGATPFVVTEECDAAPAYKQAYIDACAEDVEIIISPVGIPARAVCKIAG